MAIKPVSVSMLVFFMLAAASSTVNHAAENADFPNKPIRIIVPFPPGGGNDLRARYFADKHSPVVPEVPTFAEAGLPGYGFYGWSGFFAPAGVPPDVRRRLTKVFSDIPQDPGTRKRLAAEPRDMEPEAMRAFIRDEVKKWSDCKERGHPRELAEFCGETTITGEDDEPPPW